MYSNLDVLRCISLLVREKSLGRKHFADKATFPKLPFSSDIGRFISAEDESGMMIGAFKPIEKLLLMTY